ncbi:unnamed protein product [Clonostachys chloroleuca]|uniref:PNPLA domain-containing protein n=1 Tax=Clonostachys chloroleuca TaxID=1926264 RepID=A0AA35Q1W6_9HYPO|nr:unnamed protein product [Clonostachys chloroleuca]CAI6090993.1 unnamed protein product [Clonostachys chloroleuca]
MKSIHERIGVQIPFQRFFNMVFGISSGGLIAADLFLNGSSIDETSQAFEVLAKSIFQKKRLLKIVSRLLPDCLSHTWLSDILKVFVSCISGGLYSSSPIESVLKQVFGTRTLLDKSQATPFGTLVGLPVATTGGSPSCHIFTNRNGRISHDQFKKGFGTAKISEVYFPPKAIGDVGTFQDAGPLENDPLASAVSYAFEANPSLEHPDFILSLGTGESRPKNDVSERATGTSWCSWLTPWLYRLAQMNFMKMLDEQPRKVIQANPRYYRLTTKFDHDIPRLDDVNSIQTLQSHVDQDQTLVSKIENIAERLIASLFYFELDAVPEKIDGRYFVSGCILCDIAISEPAFPGLFRCLDSTSAQFWINRCPMTDVVEKNSFDRYGNFRKKVALTTDGVFDIALKRGGLEACSISGAPFSLPRLIALQGLTAVFGRPGPQKEECKPKRSRHSNHQSYQKNNRAGGKAQERKSSAPSYIHHKKRKREGHHGGPKAKKTRSV